MRNFRIRIMVISLIFVCLLGPAAAVPSQENETSAVQEEAVNKLVALNLLKGYPDGSLGLENPISRVEFCAVISRMLGYEEDPIVPEVFPFTDVASDHWGFNYIATAYSLNVVAGYPDDTFKVSNQIRYSEVVTMLVRALGYANDVEGENWPDNFMQLGDQLGITNALEIDVHKPVTRGEVAVMIRNSLEIKLK